MNIELLERLVPLKLCAILYCESIDFVCRCVSFNWVSLVILQTDWWLGSGSLVMFRSFWLVQWSYLFIQ